MIKVKKKINGGFEVCGKNKFFIHVNFKRSLWIGNFIFFTFYCVLEGEEKKLLHSSSGELIAYMNS